MKSQSGTIRITGGAFRGRVLKTPGKKTHPMGDRERLALFNLIGNNLDGFFVLDAFAGSGALGIEALSRGAFKVVFVEKNNEARETIRENLRTLDCSGEVVGRNVGKYESDQEFDLIIADPPYNDFNEENICHLIDYLKSGGILVLSHPNEAPEIAEMTLEKTRQYARAHISVYRKD